MRSNEIPNALQRNSLNALSCSKTIDENTKTHMQHLCQISFDTHYDRYSLTTQSSKWKDTVV